MAPAQFVEGLEHFKRDNRRLKWLSLFLCTLVCLPARSQQTAGKSNGAAPSLEMLRFRLQVNPHDGGAHKQLIEMLRKKWLPRALVLVLLCHKV